MLPETTSFVLGINRIQKSCLFIVLFLIPPSSSLMLILDSQFCLSKYIEKRDTLRLSYQLSNEDSSIKTTIKGHRDEIVYTSEKPKDIYEKYSEKSLTYTLCFELTSGSSSIISFDFSSFNEKQYQLVNDEDIDIVYKNITTISHLFNEIEDNLKFDIEKRDSHYKTSNDFFPLINILSISKIVSLLVVSVFEIYLIARLLSKTSFTDICRDPF